MQTRFPIKTTVTVRFSDTDAMGHCNNANIISFMEEGRVEYFKRFFEGTPISDQFAQFPFILADVQCSFKAPIFCNDRIVVTVGTTHVGNKSFVFEYELYNEKTGQLVATGKSVQVMFDYKTQSSYPIPIELRHKMEQLEKQRE